LSRFTRGFRCRPDALRRSIQDAGFVGELNGDSAETVGDEGHSEDGDAEQSGERTFDDCWVTITGSGAPDFLVTSYTCGSSLAADRSNSCTISVSFKPKTKGSRSATLKITDNAQSGTQTVSLSGTGH
jgi:hypothetical protein